MKSGLLSLLLLSGCSYFFPEGSPRRYEYSLAWYCVSPESCERTEDVMRIDRVTVFDYDMHFTSTQDESFAADALMIVAESLGGGCYYVHNLTLFGHELEPSKLCYNPAGFEIELSIPDPEPATSSKWVVSATDTSLR